MILTKETIQKGNDKELAAHKINYQYIRQYN